MSVSSLPKLDDFKKAIAEVKAANTKYTTAQNSLKPSQEAIDKAKAALDAAKEKYNSLQNDYNNKSYLNNSTYQSAYNTYNDALNKATSLENYWRSRDWLKSDSGYQNATNAYNTAQQKVQTLQDYINSGKYLQDNSAYQTALNNQKAAEQKLNTARSFLESEDYLNKNSTYQNYVSAFNTADQKLNQLRDWKDSGRYLEENAAYKNAVNAIPAKEDALRAAESKLDNWTGPRSGTAWNNAVSAKIAADNAFIAAQTARDKAAEAASNAADTLIRNQDTIRSTAEQNINKTRDSLRSTAENAVNLAQTAYDATQPAIDKAQSAAQTLAQNNLDIASKALGTAETNKNIAENKADEIAWNNWQTSAKAADTLNTKANDIAKGLESVANKALETQRSAVDAQNGVYETAQNKYNDIYGEIAPDLEDYNSKLANVSNYAQTFKENLGDITSYSDVQAAKTLLDQFNSEIKNIGIDDLKNKLTPVFSDVASTAQFDQKLQQAVADYKKNIELPTLSASQVDNVLKSMANQRIGDGNSLMIPRYQTVGDDFGTKGGTVDGLNLKSVNANILTGSALFGLYKGGSQKTDDFSIADPKVDNVWHSRKATDADFAKAAADAKVDITGMTRQEAYNAINDKWKDYYSITTRGNLVTDPATGKTSDHWNSLYRRDGDNLVPVTDQNGAKVVQGFNATWHTPYEDFGSFLAGAMPAIAMALPFVIPGIGNALSTGLSGLEIAAATAPTAFTVGAPALTLGTAIGSTAVSMAANAVTNAVVTKLLNPNASGSDIATSAAVGAAGTLASSNPSKIVENIGISPDTVNKIAEASKLTPAQVNNIIATGVTKTATSIATGDPNAATNIGATVAGMFVGSEAQNLVADAFKTADPKLLNSAINAAGNVANIVTQTVIKDGDVNAALLNAAPDIITSAVKAGDAVGKTTTPVTVEERSTYPEPTPDKSDLITLNLPELPKTTPPEIADIIKSAYTDPSVKLEVSQAMPVTAENVQQLTRMAQEKVAQDMLRAAANDPSYARSVISESSIQALRQAGMSTLADGLVGIGAAITPGNIGQVTNEDQIMAEKMKDFLSPIADGTYDYTKKLPSVEVVARYNVPELFPRILPGESISKDGELIFQDGKGSGLYVDKSGTLYDQNGNPAVQNFVPPDVTPLVAPSFPLTDTNLPPGTVKEPEKKVALPSNFIPWDAITSKPSTTTTTTTATETAPTTQTETAPKTETATQTNTAPATETTPVTKPATETTPVTKPVTETAPVTKPVTDLIPVTPPATVTPDTAVTTTPSTVPTTPEVPVTQPTTTPTTTPTTPSTPTDTTQSAVDTSSILSAIANALGGVKVPTVAGGLAQVPAGYTAVTTPLAKRPIGDLYPVSNIMMSPEEIAARSTTKMVRRGGLVSR